MPFRRALLSIFILIAAIPDAGSSEPVTLPGGVWAIVPPPGFEITPDPIVAFRHPAGAAIVIHDQPRSPVTRAEFERERSAAESAGQGLPGQSRLDAVEEIVIGGNRALLIVISTPTRNVTNIQLQIEGEQLNGVIDAVVRGDAQAVSVDEVKEALLTAVERPTAMEDRLASLPFVIGDLASLRIARIDIGPAVILTDGPSDYPGLAADQLFAIVQTGRLATPPPDFHAALNSMTTETQRRYPDAIDFSSRVLEERGGQIVEITYRRLIGQSGSFVDGIVWTKVSGGRMVTALCQYPSGDPNAKARLRRVFDSITVK